MAITRDGDSAATTMNLLKNCDNFGYEIAEAQHYLEQTMQTISTGWSHALPSAVLRGTFCRHHPLCGLRTRLLAWDDVNENFAF